MKASFPVSPRGAASDRREAFTVIELLVIIGIVAVLAMIQVSALAGAQGRTKMTMCSGNVRQLTVAQHLYTGDNKDKLPVLTGSAAWAWDLPWDVGSRLLSYNLQERTFYCPGTAPRFTDWDNFLNPAAFATLWNFSPPNIHVTGYVFAYSGSTSLITVSNQNTTILAEPVKVSSLPSVPALPPPPNSERMLIADATLCSQVGGSYALRYTYNYTAIPGGFVKPHTSPHLRGQFPEGGNVGFKDGHVAWRKFDDMSPRTVSGPTFWW